MAFKVAARTILELGAELISSDAIALYELIKNSIDANSDSGVEIDFVITLSARAYREFENEWEIEESSIDEWKSKILASIEPGAPEDCQKVVAEKLHEADQWDELWDVIEHAYDELSYIEIRDTGEGMSLADLNDAFLTIGTPNRARAVMKAINDESIGEPPSLGEKGVGRLSTMRLGDTLTVTTTTEDGQFWNILEIDWQDFAEDLSAMLEDVPVAAKRGPRKDDPKAHGTTLRISRLTSTWSTKKLLDLASRHLARLADPFEVRSEPFAIRVTFNGESINFSRYIRKRLLSECHGLVKGRYVAKTNEGPKLTLTMSAPLFDRGSQTETFYEIDLLGISSKRLGSLAPSALKTLGDFKFDLYWFNRQRLKKPTGFDTLKDFRDLLAMWTGIMVYRDGYQVLPYGDEDTDWLELDRQALASSGYKLNKSQFVGRVSITRLGNPLLVDQTNREGLRDCDEKDALIRILRFTIWDKLKHFLEESERAQKQPEERDKDNPQLRKKEVTELKKRAKRTIGQVKTATSEDRVLLKEVFEMFGDLEARYRAAEKRIEAAEDERERLFDLAGVGLMIESLAHELTRTVEHSASILNKQKQSELPPDARAFFETLRGSVQSIEKRLKVLDPLSVSGRQRRRNLDLRKIVDNIIDSHEGQFERHDIEVTVLPKKRSPVQVFAIEGRIIQIIENLISNSVYWLKAQRELTPSAESSITVKLIDGSTPSIHFSDSGPGIPVERRERVFEAFYSTKEEQTRQGLGLYIARESAEFHGGSVYLLDDALNDKGNLSTFVVEIPDTRKK